MDDELTLRDLYLVLARYRAVLLALPLALAALAFAVSSLLPHRYAAQALVSVNVVTDAPTSDLFDSDPKLLPSAGALADAYQQSAPARLASLWRTDLDAVGHEFRSDQDDKSGALSLTADAASPQAARERVQAASGDFIRYVDGVTVGVLRASLGATQRRLQTQVAADQDLIRQLVALRKSVPPLLPGSGQASVREQLQQAGVDPRYAGDSYGAANPAYTLLTVRIAETQAGVAGGRANLARLQQVLNDPTEQLALSRRLVQATPLGEPALPVKPQGLGPLALAVLVYLLALVASVLGALVHHAVRDPSPRAPGRRTAPGD